MMRVCFGRLSQIFSRESQTISDYENMNLERKVSPQWIFHKFGAQD